MSRATVLGAIENYLTGEIPNIPFLTKVNPFPAKFTPEGDFYPDDDPGIESGVIIHLRLGTQDEERIALGGPISGKKLIEYELTMDCVMFSTHAKSEDAGWDNTNFIDGLISAIRASRTAGTDDGTIFQWGEGRYPSGGKDIAVESYYPKVVDLRGGKTSTFTVVKVMVAEIIND